MCCASWQCNLIRYEWISVLLPERERKAADLACTLLLGPLASLSEFNRRGSSPVGKTWCKSLLPCAQCISSWNGLPAGSLSARNTAVIITLLLVPLTASAAPRSSIELQYSTPNRPCKLRPNIYNALRRQSQELLASDLLAPVAVEPALAGLLGTILFWQSPQSQGKLLYSAHYMCCQLLCMCLCSACPAEPIATAASFLAWLCFEIPQCLNQCELNNSLLNYQATLFAGFNT